MSTTSNRLASWLPAAAAATAAAAMGYAMYRSVRVAEEAWAKIEARQGEAAAAQRRSAPSGQAAADTTTAPQQADAPSKQDGGLSDKKAVPTAATKKAAGGPLLPPRSGSAGSGGGSSSRRAATPPPPAAAAAAAGDPDDVQDADADKAKQQQHEQRGAACDACGKKAAPSAASSSSKPLQRCSRCRDAFYCGPACQREHAPQHRAECDRKSALLEEAKAKIAAAEQEEEKEEKAGKAAPAAAAAPPAAAKAATAPASEPPAAAQEEEAQPKKQHDGAKANGDKEAEAPATAAAPSTAAPKSDAQTVMEALASHLQGHADGPARDGEPLARAYERAVVAFVRGEYQSAIEQMKGVKALADKEGDRAVAGDALRWTGHAHNRLGDATAATRAFVEGVEIARAAIKVEEEEGEREEEKKEEGGKGGKDGKDGKDGSSAKPPALTRAQRLARLRKLEVDCLSGLGVMARGQGRPAEAVTHLSAALEAADKLGDRDARAGVLANLGAARLPLDRARATSELAESVALREERVVELHARGERQGLATAILEHAGALVSLAGALYAGRRHGEAAAAYERALEVFEAIGDGDKALGALANLANLHELQMTDSDAAQLEARARATEAARRRRRSGGGGDKEGDEEAGDEEEENGVLVAGAAWRRAAAFRQRLHDLAKEVLPQRGEQEADCALCDEPLEEEEKGEWAGAAASAGGSKRRRRRIIVLGCLHSHHEPCWRAWCERPGQPECPTCAKELEELAAVKRRQEQARQEQQE